MVLLPRALGLDGTDLAHSLKMFGLGALAGSLLIWQCMHHKHEDSYVMGVAGHLNMNALRKLVLPGAAVVKVGQEPSEHHAPHRVRSILWAKAATALAKARPNSDSHYSKYRLQNLESVVDKAAPSLTPLLAFVNSRSGGQQGISVINQLRAQLHHLQIVDLGARGASPEPALRWWSGATKNFRILVCGGDGTVAWVLGALDGLRLDYVPPVAILPLGTGNDLARVLGWGGGFAGGSVLPILQQVGQAHASLLDQWTVSFGDTASAPEPKTLCNYFGVGVDAAVALSFHEMRKRRPDLFVSRLLNKLWYMRSGAKAFFGWSKMDCTGLWRKIVLKCDGKGVELPPELEGVIVLNVRSFGGGSDLWGADAKDGGDGPQFERPSMGDQKLEVVGVQGALALGRAQVGLSSAVRLAQARHVEIALTGGGLPVQVDGEPFPLEQGTKIEIGWKSQAIMLARHGNLGALGTDVVEWALQRNIIDKTQHGQLIREIADRAQELCEH